MSAALQYITKDQHWIIWTDEMIAVSAASKLAFQNSITLKGSSFNFYSNYS